ncbi:MAG: DUF2779 domain-containing protein [Clostridia bacterium]
MITEVNFTKFNGCPRQAYLLSSKLGGSDKNRSEGAISAGRLRNVQRDMLKSFPGGVTVYGDVKHAAIDTRLLIDKGAEVIYNATFVYRNFSARCDVIVAHEGVYDIYAVRPTARYTRWIDEVLYDKIIMKMAGVNVGRCLICAINKEGEKNNILSVINVDNEKRQQKLYEKIKCIAGYIESGYLPKPELSKQCGACTCFKNCFGDREDSIFSIKSLQFPKKMSLYKSGITTVDKYLSLPNADERVIREIKVRQTDEDVYNKEEIKAFLNKLSYPLGFLDFETMEVFVPNDPILSPMDTVITQFSYHVIEKEGEKPKHYEFIGDGESYCEREVAELLIKYIGKDHTVLMYSDYERICIDRIIKRLPEYSADLEAICKNLVDLEKPFAKKHLVNRRMEGKSSLKKVLPALYPDDESLSYSKMKIQNGQQAESVYARLHKMTGEEKQKAISDLKDYCALDTLAMIKLWERLEYYGKMM